MIDAVKHMCRRLHISWLRARQNQIRLAIEQAALDPSPAATLLVADLMVECIEIDLRIQQVERQ